MDKNTHIKKLISILNLDCTTKLKNDKERNFHNGHEYVDLGLPSGTLWATCNVGAENETDFGNYYKYGDGSKVYVDTVKSYQGMETPLDPNADTATQVWGGKWRMPTKEQVGELIANTTYEWVVNYKDSGINGVVFIAYNGNSVFFPACGYKYGGNHFKGCNCHYWTSSHLECHAYEFLLSVDSLNLYTSSRYNGYSVRGVLDSK